MAEPSRSAAVLGKPIAHSLSPVLHRAAYAALGLHWSYEAIECDEATLPDVLAGRADWAGVSCTMPLKRAALQIAEQVSELAAAVGAANTLLPLGAGRWRAENTDVHGIAAALAEHEVAPATVTVLGAGGTAQAAVAALGRVGPPECTVLVRDPSRTGELAATATASGVEIEIGTLAADAPALDADLVISTLPAGAADPIAARDWAFGQVLLDVVYDPWPTAVASAAKAAGATVISGALMLLHQAAEQVRLMTRLEPPVEAMRAALREARPHAGL